MRLLGHRGASRDFPENTVEALVAAMEQRADGVELDVMRCASGELVVCHDEVLTRLAGLKLEVRRTRWSELKHLDVGSRLGFRPARIPLLHDVFDALPARAWVNVELKCETTEDDGLSEAVGALVTARNLEERVFISSFNPLCLVRLANAWPALRRGLLIDPDKPWAPQAWFWLPVTARTSVHPHFSQVTAGRINRWHQRGWEVAAWTVDDVEEARRLRALGVDWLITNTPGALRERLRSVSG